MLLAIQNFLYIQRGPSRSDEVFGHGTSLETSLFISIVIIIIFLILFVIWVIDKLSPNEIVQDEEIKEYPKKNIERDLKKISEIIKMGKAITINEKIEVKERTIMMKTILQACKMPHSGYFKVNPNLIEHELDKLSTDELIKIHYIMENSSRLHLVQMKLR